MPIHCFQGHPTYSILRCRGFIMPQQGSRGDGKHRHEKNAHGLSAFVEFQSAFASRQQWHQEPTHTH